MERSVSGMMRIQNQRKLRNFLLDRRFQLKFVAYAVTLTVLISGVLGLLLWRTTLKLFHQSELAVQARSQAAESSRELGNAALTHKLLARFDDPTFEQILRERARAIDERYDAEKRAIIADSAEIVRRQQATVAVMVASLVGFILVIGLVGVVLTHRIVGPLFRIKRMTLDITEGHLRMPTHALREHDELKDVFGLYSAMILKLREREEKELADVVRVLAEPALSAESKAALQAMAAAKRERLERAV
jgi:hypothetical protein